ncbi:NfeD family protein [Synoicihabitans lomoniglobus]|uniref:NfeD family protein n=1 Tax=Synoicihabitans lomoniglobus TaxID=2909285 RepID=A0AAE9ZRM9_9BACT|nr:serine protease [Opitutaceae bacterium LMO-M01]WED63990.1 NfeD family protein [Opitutaceae bacterium LMO-M01]
MTIIGVLFLIGIVFLGFEVFLPGGILGVFGGLALLGGCVMAFVGYGVGGGGLAILTAFLLVVAVLYFEFAILPKTAIGKRLFLHAAVDGTSSVARATDLVGQLGTTATALAPSGYIVIDGRRHEAFSRGGFLEAGAAVKVVATDNFRLIVIPESS